MKGASLELAVQTGVKAGGMSHQHARRVSKVRTALKSGGVSNQHNRRVLMLMNARG
jgi:hypothetical protein